jgi:sialate O-acetylesterase
LRLKQINRQTMKTIIHGKWRKPGYWGFACMCLCLALNAGARVVPASLFTDHMVLQHGKPIYVWGTASPGEQVHVSIGVLASGGASADSEGNWLVELPVQPVAASPLTLHIRGENEIRIEDVLIGEVWLGSGQSNMGVSTGETDDWDSVQKEIAGGNYKSVRIFKMAWTASDTPLRACGKSSWRVSDNGSIRYSSAVMVYFARALQRANPGVPIGILQSAVGATNAHAWLPNAAFENGKGAEHVRLWYKAQLEKMPVENKLYAEKLEQHREAVEKAKQEKKQPPRAPEPPMGPESKRRPACLYNGMIAPLQPYGICGVAWYQGENNSSLQWAGDYAALMSDLINGWRADWARAARRDKPDMLPFLIVQLPNFKNGNVWPLLREQQERIVQSIPETVLICIIDSGDPKDIHPRNKTPVGERLALAARALVYGEGSLVWSGPVFRDAACGDGKAVVSFKRTGGGLITADGEPPHGFEIAGDDRKFFPAAAKIFGQSVILESPHVPRPVVVRYAWENNPENLNLYNKENLPAHPFRTDDWPWPAGGKSK